MVFKCSSFFVKENTNNIILPAGQKLWTEKLIKMRRKLWISSF